MSGERILVVDDDPGIVDVVSYALRSAGFRVESAADADEATSAIPSGFDLLVLDLMLPGESGLDICRRLRNDGNVVPILMLTAKDAEVDRVVGLEVGADDYVTKPFSSAELVSRVRAIFRRREFDREESGAAVRRVGDLTVDFHRHEVTVAGRSVALTPSEFRLLSLLAESPGRVFSRREIMKRLWNSDHVGDEHACDVHVSNLRHKLEADPATPQIVLTVRGFGYKLAA